MRYGGIFFLSYIKRIGDFKYSASYRISEQQLSHITAGDNAVTLCKDLAYFIFVNLFCGFLQNV